MNTIKSTVNRLIQPIYMDYAATTPVDERVIQKMLQNLSFEGAFGNPASDHVFGNSARQIVEESRQTIAKVLNATSRQIIFTSCATESNNLAIKGVAEFYQNRGKHIVTSLTEHKSVIETCAYLEKKGFHITYLKPKKNGRIELEALKSALTKDTILVSIMHVNNETGVIQDIAEIGRTTRALGVFFHVDAAQSIGKLPIDVQDYSVDLLSVSAHKIYGPKGIGALYIGDIPRVRLVPLLHGGAQERKLRAGSLPTHQIVGMSEAFRIAIDEMPTEMERLKILRDYFWSGIKDLPGVYLNHDLELSLPNILNIRFEAIDKEPFLASLKALAITSASACNSVNIEPSVVLQAMGLSVEQAHRSFRFSFGRFTTKEEIAFTIQIVREKYLEGRKKT